MTPENPPLCEIEVEAHNWHVEAGADGVLGILDDDRFVVAILGFTGPDAEEVANTLANASVNEVYVREVTRHLKEHVDAIQQAEQNQARLADLEARLAAAESALKTAREQLWHLYMVAWHFRDVVDGYEVTIASERLNHQFAVIVKEQGFPWCPPDLPLLGPLPALSVLPVEEVK